MTVRSPSFGQAVSVSLPLLLIPHSVFSLQHCKIIIFTLSSSLSNSYSETEIPPCIPDVVSVCHHPGPLILLGIYETIYETTNDAPYALQTPSKLPRVNRVYVFLSVHQRMVRFPSLASTCHSIFRHKRSLTMTRLLEKFSPTSLVAKLGLFVLSVGLGLVIGGALQGTVMLVCKLLFGDKVKWIDEDGTDEAMNSVSDFDHKQSN